VIGFDMGGTSTDVSRYDGAFQHVFETTTAGITIQSPQLDISTVAAGGGSRLFFRNGLFVVGPESAGAHPGPVCYRKGGVLAVTDANVLLGRVVPKYFPHIFGPREDEPLDVTAVQAAFADLTGEVNAFAAAESTQAREDGGEVSRVPKTADEVAYGFLRVANEAMCRPIRNLTTMRGFDITTHALACFGGAGPQHCCAIAKALGMRRIIVSRFSGVLSAYGIHLADIAVEKQEPAAGKYDEESLPTLEARLDVLEKAAREELVAQGFAEDAIRVERFLNLRFAGTDCALMTARSEEVRTGGRQSDGGEWDGGRLGCSGMSQGRDYRSAFESNYQREFGFKLEGRDVLVDDVRVRVTGRGQSEARFRVAVAGEGEKPRPVDYGSVFFEGVGRVETPLYKAEGLKAGFVVPGPAILMQEVSTVVVEPGCTAHVTSEGNFEILVGAVEEKRITTTLDPIYLSIFAHRFMGVAEQMGRTLQRTSISVNIKERLDFSCALFDETGGLVANAPHLPVHLGAMQEAVRYQLKHWGREGLRDGDVLVSNHPQLAGGSHLPDITVITPVFDEGRLVFFVASRGHHADVGGLAPGSMPPMSKRLDEEGAAIVAFKLVEGGVFQEAGITALLGAPARVPGCSGTRNLQDNLSDLRAQVAANTQGRLLMQGLISEYGLGVIQAYMQHIQDNAEQAVRAMLTRFSLSQELPEVGTVGAEDFLDDGTPICLEVTIDRARGSAVFDFAGTGPELYGNLNAPPAVTASAVIYCLRCLLPDADIPLNQGCLVPVEIRIPPSSLLNPSPSAAVVGGNVLTSQRITDVIFRAFGAVAASQGCMNNLTFGDASMGYYETIAGGAGAGPSWHGESGVHTHMTNTRITDPEILERRFPVILRQFVLRDDSGGKGVYAGGDGVVRALEFRRPLVVSILSERRAFRPYGLAGGGDGARGLNLLTFAGGAKSSRRLVNLGGKNTVQVHAGDILTIHTPGGGGFGGVTEEVGLKQGRRVEKFGGVGTQNGRRDTLHHLGNKGGGSLGQYKATQESA
jgi:5-oxoprolinase (ATP-hydrolysing)